MLKGGRLENRGTRAEGGGGFEWVEEQRYISTNTPGARPSGVVS